MKLIKIAIFIFGLVPVLLSCSDQEADDQIIIVEYIGSSDYFIENSTDFDLNVIFVKSEQLGFEVDSTKSILKNMSSLIFSDAIIANNPTPNDSFSEIKLFKTVNDSLILVYQMSPIDDDKWIITEQSEGEGGLNHTQYTLSIRNQDLN